MVKETEVIDTTRRDLGNDKTITGKTNADVEYSNVNLSYLIARKKFSLSEISIQNDVYGYRRIHR